MPAQVVAHHNTSRSYLVRGRRGRVLNAAVSGKSIGQQTLTWRISEPATTSKAAEHKSTPETENKSEKTLNQTARDTLNNTESITPQEARKDYQQEITT